jgi:hypothetical protein
MKYEKLSKNPKQFLAMTGYTSEEFDSLLPYFEIRFADELKRKTLTGNRRTGRGYGEYKSSPLSGSRGNLLFILVYLKQGMTQENLASLFGMHQPDANRRIHFLHPLLKGALKDSGELPVRDAERLDFENEKQNIFLHDGTERPVVRPKDNDKRRLYFSGKKRWHSLKNILISDALCRVVFLSFTCEGKKHDKKAADEAGYSDCFPEGAVLLQDTGFQGFSAESVRIIQPKKKPRGGELTEEEKERNRKISGIRIRIEHVISGVKRYRIVKDKIRNWKKGFRDTVMETCCGLHNFRLRFRPWTPVAIESL